MKVAGFDVENLPMSDEESCDLGLKYSNNEVCYPATLIVGDVVKAFKSGKYNPDETAVIITQTGGQCRASNYIALIKRALLANGYKNTPVVSFSFGSGIANEQPGFDIPWRKLIPVALATMLYSDSIAKLYYATVARECVKGKAAALRDEYLDQRPFGIRRKFQRIADQIREHLPEHGQIPIDQTQWRDGDARTWILFQQFPGHHARQPVEFDVGMHHVDTRHA